MIDKWSLYLFLNLLCHICTAVPTNMAKTTKSPTITTPTALETTSGELIVNPDLISLENLETLLRQAGEIFLPANLQLIETTSNNQQDDSQREQKQQQQVPVPYLQMQPPADQPYNFYLPLYEFDKNDKNEKRDDATRKMEHFAPPPVPSKDQQNVNYYATKPKKMPKKFIGGSKHINMHWLMDLEKQAVSSKAIDFSKAPYLVNDERNRINFDDSFFGVDMQLKVADNQPHKEIKLKQRTKAATSSEFLNNGEEMAEDGEDLIAAPTLHLAQVIISKRDSQ